MALKLENFGKIKKAEIELRGLTVITGHNDTGKSTFGKALFAIVKAISGYPDLYKKAKSERVSPEFYSILFEVNQDDIFKKSKTLLEEAQKFLSIEFYFTKSEGEKEKEMLSFLASLEYFLKKENKEHILLRRIENLTPYIEKSSSKEEIFEEIASMILGKTFFGEINNSLYVDDVSSLSYTNQGEIIAQVIVKENDVEKTKLCEEKKPRCFSEATFIDTPFYLDSSFEGKSYFAQDLSEKLEHAKKNLKTKKNTIVSGIFQKIADILHGASFSYNLKRGRLEYQVSKKASSLSISSIASGSKSFGLLSLLIKSGVLKKTSILILDEPENHLHPQWQLKYAEVLAMLVSEGYYVLLTSHSPFFVQALKQYAYKYKILETKTHFYLAEKESDESNYSTIKDVTKETELIFEDLSEPLDALFLDI